MHLAMCIATYVLVGVANPHNYLAALTVKRAWSHL